MWMLSSCAGGMPKVPAKPDDVLTRADELLKKGKHLQAVALYQKFLENYVGHERADYAQYKLAESYLEGEEYELAARLRDDIRKIEQRKKPSKKDPDASDKP